MATPDPTYSFLPWMRRGIAAFADAGSLSASDPVNVSVLADAMGEGKPSIEVKQSIKLYGPGHVTGIDHRSVVRTIPRRGVKSFEANFLCAIEFYDEDFPWRYTPLLPAGGKLQPWIWLVVLKQDEFQRSRMTETSLPAIEIFSAAMSKAFPDPATTWAWAHTHLNFAVDASKPIIDQRTAVKDKLNENANLGCSRLICPRHLQPSTQYTAFLIPAFEKGRLAGLGKEEEVINAIPNAQPSWSSSSAATVFPVYYEWDFVTQSRGDFESLARLLSPLNEEESKNLAQAGLTMDISNPGWGLTHKGANPVINCESALNPLNRQAYTLLTDSILIEDKNFTKAIGDLINLGVASASDTNAVSNPFYENSNLEDDPIIVPPLYGSFYRDNPIKTSSLNPAKTDPAKNKDWYNQLNLNPAFRIAASAGTAVVQKDQEVFMDRAWDQLNLLNEERLLAKRWHYSMEVSDVFFNKRINPIVSAQVTENAAGAAKAYNALSLLAPMYKSLALDKKSFSEVVKTRPMSSVYTASFNKITRPGGPLTSRVNAAAVANTGAATTGATASSASGSTSPASAGTHTVSGAVISTVATPAATAAGTSRSTSATFLSTNRISGAFLNTMLVAEPFVIVQRDYLLEILNEIVSEFKMMDRVFRLSTAREEKNEQLVSEGLAGFGACHTAFIKLQNLFKKETRQPVTIVSDIKLFSAIAMQIKPAATVTARFHSMLPDKKHVAINSSSVVADAPEFPEPMYRSLAEQSTDYILPGLSEIPPNKVALLVTNQSFIESYMVGLNHEIAREYLWREFPAPLNGTSFKQFWDIRNNPAAAANPEKFKDIKAIKNWFAANGFPSQLGKNPASGKPTEKMVVLVRGDLLRKYPNTEIYMHKAKWIGPNNTKPREPEAIDDSNVKYPLFSAFIEPDYQFIGFDVNPNEAIGINNDAGWYFVMKERAGDIHFGLDLDKSTTNPSWAALESTTPENTCINVSSAGFKSLPKYPRQLGERADRFAKMLYQQPFQLFVHASRMVIKQ
jgi:hypothetical protein